MIDYVRRSLTFKKDRFPAIAALVKEFPGPTSYHYVAGIWVQRSQENFCSKIRAVNLMDLIALLGVRPSISANIMAHGSILYMTLKCMDTCSEQSS